jgi:uncharacterized cofD-like protein
MTLNSKKIQQKKVVVIGGGTGSYTVLRGLKSCPVDITAIVTMFDSGGSSGQLRDEFGVLPPGDIRRCLVALSDGEREGVLRDLFNYRFAGTKKATKNQERESKESLAGHNFGNLFITALTHVLGDGAEAIKKAGELLNIHGRVFPVSETNAHLCAELETGEIIVGETNIDIPKHDPRLKIKKVFLKPPALLFKEARKAILEADLIVLGPGDLYTSIIPNLLVRGMGDALKKSRAKKVYVANLMTKQGETNGYVLSDFIQELLNYSGLKKFDAVICNSACIPLSYIKKYKEENKEPLGIDRGVKKYAKHIIKAPLFSDVRVIRHDSDVLARLIMKLL